MFIEELHGLHATDILLDTRFGVFNSKAKYSAILREALSENEEIIGSFSRETQQDDSEFIENLKHSDISTRRLSGAYVAPRRTRSNSLSNMSVSSTHSNRSGNRLRRAASYTDLVSEHVKNEKQRFQGSFWRQTGGHRINRFRHNMWHKYGRPVIIHNHFGNVKWSKDLNKSTFKNRSWGHGGRSHYVKPAVTKEELDEELDQYMALSRTALDKEIEAYRKQHTRIIFQ